LDDSAANARLLSRITVAHESPQPSVDVNTFNGDCVAEYEPQSITVYTELVTPKPHL